MVDKVEGDLVGLVESAEVDRRERPVPSKLASRKAEAPERKPGRDVARRGPWSAGRARGLDFCCGLKRAHITHLFGNPTVKGSALRGHHNLRGGGRCQAARPGADGASARRRRPRPPEAAARNRCHSRAAWASGQGWRRRSWGGWSSHASNAAARQRVRRPSPRPRGRPRSRRCSGPREPR